MSLASKLEKSGPIQKVSPSRPVWKGPQEDGITQSLLSRFLVCKERFRLLVVEGLRPAPTFSHRMEYGQMWHVCEEALANNQRFLDPLIQYCRSLCERHKTQQEQIQHWYEVCKVQFPLYVDYWAKHPDVQDRKPQLQEEVFDVPYPLPSGRVVRLRGKWDSVDLIGKKRECSVYLQENKTKGDIVEEQLKRQLSFDLQTLMYLVALQDHMKRIEYLGPLRGVRYNIVRRPLSGGKGSIRQLQSTKSNPAGESKAEFYGRLLGVLSEEPAYWFMRWKVEISPQDLERFKLQFLNPCLEHLCDWWEWVATHLDDPFDGGANCTHWRTPYGIWNPLLEGGSTELDEFLDSGSELGLERAASLFGELQ